MEVIPDHAPQAGHGASRFDPARGGAYYNEIDPFAAAWLRELIKGGHIAPGIVDERDIRDVRPDELAGFVQCHFFAGIGVWSYALRRAGWPDDRPVWTGSCPCQPFSAAGKGGGFDDERHLWPAFFHLISQCGSGVVLGEQVASKDGLAWLDLVQADMEAAGHAFGAVDLCAAGFGAPHMRQRLFWVAYAVGGGRARLGGEGQERASEHSGLGWLEYADTKRFREEGQAGAGERPAEPSTVGRMGHAHGEPCQWVAGGVGRAEAQINGEGFRVDGPRCHGLELADDAIGLADRLRAGRPERRAFAGDGQAPGGGIPGHGHPGPANGFWRNVDWLYCRDPGGARWRPVAAGTFPLAPSAPARVGILRGSGNAINAEVATGFIEAVIEHLISRDSDAMLARRPRSGLSPEGVAARAEGIAQEPVNNRPDQLTNPNSINSRERN